MKRLLFCLLVLMAAISCKKKDQDAGNTGSPKIVISNYPDDADTLTANYNAQLHVSIVGSQFPKYALVVSKGASFVSYDSSYDGTFRFWVDRVSFYSGFYNCLFKVYGGQSFQSFYQIFSHGVLINQRSVVINLLGFLRLPDPVFTVKNGTLEGRFDTLSNIRSLAIMKYYTSSNPNVPVDSVTATGHGEIAFNDNSYVGEKAWYSMNAYSLNDSGMIYKAGSGSFSKPLEIKPPLIYSDGNGWPVIQWNRSRYNQNFGSYRIRKQTGYNTSTLLKEITDINDTLETGIDLGFPSSPDIYLTHIPKMNQQYITTELEMQDFGNAVTYTPGIPFPPFDEFNSPRGNDIFLYRNSDTYLYRYSASTFQKTDSIYCSLGIFAVSANDKYVLTNRDNRFHLYNVETRQDISVNISDFLTHLDEGYTFDVADNGIIAVMDDFDYIRLIDVVHNQLLGSLFVMLPMLYVCQIAPNGDYVCDYSDDKYRVYKFAGGTFTEVFNAGSFGFGSLKFIADQPGKALLFLDSQYEIYNLVTGSVEFSAPYAGSGEMSNIDFNDYLFIKSDDNFFRIIDINSGNVVKTIAENQTGNYHVIYLHGHTLFNAGGSWLRF